MYATKPQTPIINWDHPLAKGLVCDLPFAEQAGNNTRDNYSGKIATLTNGPTWTRGLLGPAVTNNGSDDYVSVTTPAAATQMGKYSIQIIFTRASGGVGGAYGGLLFKTNGTTKYFDIENDNGDVGWGMVFVSYWTGPTVRVWSVPYPTNNVVQNYIITYDHTTNSTTPKWYINGIDTAVTDRFNNSSGTPQTDGSNLYVGNNESQNLAWDGKIFLTRMWRDRILTPNDVSQLTTNPWQIYKQPRFAVLNSISAAGTSIKTFLGLSKSSVKTVNGLAIANVKTWNGLA